MMDWRPWVRQELFLSLPWYEVLFGGAKGPGKTDCLLAEATRQKHISGYKAIIFRRTNPRLQEIIDRSLKWFSGIGTYNSTEKRWTFNTPDGGKSYLQFGHCQHEKDKFNYHGHEYHYMGFDQIEEFTETQYLFLIAQNRSSNPNIKCYVRATANPGNVGHGWVKRRFVDVLDGDGQVKYFKRVNDEDMECAKDDPLALSRAFVFSTLDDNPSLTENDPEYEKRLMMLPEDQMKAMRFGDWDAFAGQYFKTFRKNIHVIPDFDYKGQLCTIVLALDYGYAAFSSVGWYAVMPGKVIRFHELYTNQKTYAELALGIKEVNRQLGISSVSYMVCDTAIWGDREHHSDINLDGVHSKGQSGAEIMQSKLTFPLIQADKRRVVGWNRCREELAPFKGPHGEMTARFQVTANCKNFIRTIPDMVHDATKVEDLDTTAEDHAADEWRYFVMSRPNVPTPPPEEKTSAQEFWDRVKEDMQEDKDEWKDEGEIDV